MKPIAYLEGGSSTRVLVEADEGFEFEVDYIGRAVRAPIAWLVDVDPLVAAHLRVEKDIDTRMLAYSHPQDERTYFANANKLWVPEKQRLIQIGSRRLSEVPTREAA